MSSTSLKNLCECYKKLNTLGIPLYINEENADYTEQHSETFYEKACQLPESIRINEQIMVYPVIAEYELSDTFQEMSQVILGLTDFETNIMSFWILDMFIEGLGTAQKVGMHHAHQKALLLWIAYFFNYIQRENPTRKQLFGHLKEILFLPKGEISENSDGTLIITNSNTTKSENETIQDEDESWPLADKREEIWTLPLPPLFSEVQDEEETLSENSTNNFTSNTENNGGKSLDSHLNSFNSVKSISERNVFHMNIILEIIYRIFARVWVYQEISTSFNNMPPVETVELPFMLHTPKPIFKPEPTVQGKGGKKTTAPDKSAEQIEAEKQLHKNDFILPLMDSYEAKEYVTEIFGHASRDRNIKDDKKKH